MVETSREKNHNETSWFHFILSSMWFNFINDSFSLSLFHCGETENYIPMNFHTDSTWYSKFFFFNPFCCCCFVYQVIISNSNWLPIKWSKRNHRYVVEFNPLHVLFFLTFRVAIIKICKWPLSFWNITNKTKTTK